MDVRGGERATRVSSNRRIREPWGIDNGIHCGYNRGMNPLQFTWDPVKARANAEKHGVTFEEARTVFFDENALEFYDDVHSEWEERFLLLGVSGALRLLLVCHCVKEEEGLIRIISARKATKNEAKWYQGG